MREKAHSELDELKYIHFPSGDHPAKVHLPPAWAHLDGREKLD